MNIRFATPEDIDAIGFINYTSWQETYRGIVDDKLLDAMTIEQMKDKWRPFFKGNMADKFLLVMENAEGEVCGYCCAGKIREALHDFDAEVYAIYLLRKFQGKGWGKELLREGMKELKKRDFNSCCIFVLQGNPSEGFYRALKPDWEDTDGVKLGDKDYIHVRLGWYSLEKFIANWA